MSDYSKSTNFTTKDTLPTGNSGKIVKGTELDTEFTAISSAIASKADISSPALLGTPTTPTATAGSNTTQIASTAFVKAAIDAQGLGNIATQAKTAVDITGGTIVGITDLAVADGGTGRSTLTANAVLVGNGTSGINSVAPSTSGNVLTSNGTSWASTAPATIKGLGLGGEVWNNVTSSRSFNTDYTNSRSYPIMVSVTFNVADNSNQYIYVAGTLVWQFTHSAYTIHITGTVIVPPGATYKAQHDDTGSSLTNWAELY